MRAWDPRRERRSRGRALPRRRRNDEARLAVRDDLGQAAHGAHDHRASTLHRLERDHPETLPEGGDDDDRGVVDRLLHGGDEAEEAHGVAIRTPGRTT